MRRDNRGEAPVQLPAFLGQESSADFNVIVHPFKAGRQEIQTRFGITFQAGLVIT